MGEEKKEGGYRQGTMKKYDAYDYEKAYQKQVSVLEEWELQRLLKEGKVPCLYRTTTIKSKNQKSGAVILESMVYPAFRKKADMPKPRKEKGTKPSQRDVNDKNARRYLVRLANINFGAGDIWGTFGWDEEHKPESIEAAQKDVQNYIKRLRYHRKKKGVPQMKYIYILSVGENTRPHFHILLDGKGLSRDEIEALWDKCQRKNTRRLVPDDDFLLTGLATYIARQPKEKRKGRPLKRWCASKNLQKPSRPVRSYSKFKKRQVERMAKDAEVLKEQMEKAYPGYRFLDAEVRHNGVNAAFYLYARMTKQKEKRQKKAPPGKRPWKTKGRNKRE